MIKKSTIKAPVFSLLSCLAISGCDGCDSKPVDSNNNQELKLKIEPLGRYLKDSELSCQLPIEVEAGDAPTSEYRVKIEQKSFDSDDWTGPETADDAEKTKLVAPDPTKTLEENIGAKRLKQGDKTMLYCRLDPKHILNTGLSVSADLSIVRKSDGKVVGGPVTIQWTYVK